MKWTLFKGFILVAIAVMAIIPLMSEKVSKTTVSSGQIIDKIKPIAVEQPLHNVRLPDFANISDIKTRKKVFFDFLKPAIDKENQRLKALRQQLSHLLDLIEYEELFTAEQSQLINAQADKYSVKQSLSSKAKLVLLLTKVDQIPRELVLVQAANESAWGSSRFARIGLNFFGIWCFKVDCGLVPKGRDSGLKHEVAAFDSIEQMIGHYFHNLNTNTAYGLMRSIRSQLREHNLPLKPDVLATGLLPYSERGMDYIVEINTMLRHNQAYIKA